MSIQMYIELLIVLFSLKPYGLTEMVSQRKIFENGDLILTAMFPMTIQSEERNETIGTHTCSPFELGLHLADVFRDYVKKVNDEDMLKGIRLGYDIRDTCSRLDKSVKIALEINERVKKEIKQQASVSGNNGTDTKINKTIAVIGAGKSELSITVNSILSALDIPQVSYASTSKLLSDKDRFPTFSRTIPIDTLKAKVIAVLLSKFEWTYAILVYSDDNYGRPLETSLLSHTDREGICFADIVKLKHQPTDKYLDTVVSRIKNHRKANVVIVFLNSIISERLIGIARSKNVIGKVWIFTPTWYNSRNIFQEYASFLDGSIGVVDEIIDVAEIYSNSTFEKNAGLRGKKDQLVVSGENDGIDKNSASFTLLGTIPLTHVGITKVPYVADAVLAVVNAINTFCSDNAMVSARECQKHIKPSSILQYLRNVSFKGLNNRVVHLDQNGDPVKSNIELYSVISGKTTHLVRMGLYVGLNDTLLTNLENLKWSRGTRPFSKCSLPCSKGYYTVANVMRKCCWQCILCPPGQFNDGTNSDKCQLCPDGSKPNQNKTYCEVISYKYFRWNDPWAVFISISSVFSSLVAFISFVLFIHFRDTPVVRASDREFSLLILLSLVAGLTLPMMFPGTPTNFRCRLQKILPSFIYTLTLSLIVARINRTKLIFNMKRVSPIQKMFVRRSVQFSLVLFATSTQLIICLVWLSSRPPYVKEITFYDYRYISCDFNSLAFFLLSKSILLILSFACMGMAHISRHIPCSYNNARQIVFALLTFKVTWLIGIVGNLLGDSGAIIDSLTILISYSFFLYLMFSAKVYILLFRNDLNNPRVFRERTWAFTLKSQTASLGSLQFSAPALDKAFTNNEHMVMESISKQDKGVQTDDVFF